MANLYDIMDAYGESTGYNYDIYNQHNSIDSIENIFGGYDELDICDAKDNVRNVIIQSVKEDTWEHLIKIEYNNKTRSIIEWADILGIKYDTLYSRYKRKWSAEKIITTPVGKRDKIKCK